MPVLISLLIVWGLAVNATAQIRPELVVRNLIKIQSEVEKKGYVSVIIGFEKPEYTNLAQKTVSLQDRREIIGQQASEFISVLESYELGNIEFKPFKYIPYGSALVGENQLDLIVDIPEVKFIGLNDLSDFSAVRNIDLVGGTNVRNNGYSGEGHVVVVMDSGVDSQHPGLLEKVVHQACFSTSNIWDGADSLCPDGSEEQIGEGAGEECDVDLVDGCDHGTHVAGIIAGNGGVGYDDKVYGIAPGVDLISIQVFTLFENNFLNDDNCKQADLCISSYSSDQIRALEYILEISEDYNIASVNLSLGSEETYNDYCDAEFPEYQAIVDELRGKGIAVVAASGNKEATDGLSSPACLSGIISVGATDYDDYVASFSNSAGILDLLAPGVNIGSLVPGGGIESMNGTSMAAPHVSGAIALVRERYGNISIDESVKILKATGEKVIDSRNNIEKPRLQIDRALGVDRTPPVVNSYYFSEDGKLIVEFNESMDGSVLDKCYTGSQAYPIEIWENGGRLWPESDYCTSYDSNTMTMSIERKDGWADLETVVIELIGDWSDLAPIRSANGVLLDGNDDGIEGDNYVIEIDFNNLGQLQAGFVSPVVGTTDDIFTFSVTYTSSTNTPPDDEAVTLVLDGVSYPMTGNGDKWRTGVSYTTERSELTAGAHHFYFTTYVNGTEVRFPESEDLSFNVSQSVNGWDAAIESAEVELIGETVNVDVEVANLSDDGNVYEQLTLKAYLYSPQGKLLDVDDVEIYNLLPTYYHDKQLDLDLPQSAGEGSFPVDVEIIVDIDENLANNVASRFVIKGEQGVFDQYVVDEYNTCQNGFSDCSSVGYGSTFSVNGSLYKTLVIGNDKVRYERPTGSQETIGEGELHLWSDVGHVIILKSILASRTWDWAEWIAGYGTTSGPDS